MLGLAGYGIVAIITTIFLRPLIKFGTGFSSYLCVFGFIYAIVLFPAPRSYFEPNWFKYIGYSISVICIIAFIFLVWKKMKKQEEILSLMKDE